LKRYFGTDGMRGAFGAEPLVETTVRALGAALGRRAKAAGNSDVVAVGDTRESTAPLARWMAQGMRDAGARLVWGGVLPTGAAAFAAPARGSAFALAISASHNPHPDNGIKIIGADGAKLPDAVEADLEHELSTAHTSRDAQEPISLTVDTTIGAAYQATLLGTLDGEAPLSGLRLILDLSNGAATTVAAAIYQRAGAQVETIGDRPDGRNINLDCGSTHPEALVRAVRERGADLGLAFDGDADRVIAVDETGEVRDGDALLYAWAVDLHRRGRLRPAAIVATTMSNLGLERALADQGIAVVRCDVGDRYVMETLRRDGLLLGGEQSGHLLRTDLSTTGDGLLTGLHVAAVVARSGRPASQSFAGFRRYPQRLHNVPVRDKKPFAELPHVAEAASDVERELAGDGRLVLRYSGTERLARIMIEAPDQATVDRLVERLAQAFAREAVSAASAEAAGAGGVRP
jgi:phosphoglucosamine mutase